MENLKSTRSPGETGIMITPIGHGCWQFIKQNNLAGKYYVTPSQVALNWLIQYNGDTVVAIPGATKETHVKENCGALSFRLSPEDMDKLDKVSSVFK